MMDINTMIKKCTKCETLKSIDEFYFRDMSDGTRRSVCKECTMRRHGQYYLENKEKILKGANNHYKSNRVLILKTRKLWRTYNKKKISDGNKLYRKKNKEKIAEHGRTYYQNNKDNIKERAKQYRKDNKEHSVEYDRQYYIKNKKYLKEYQKQYYRNNKSTINKYLKNRRRTDPIFKLKHYVSTHIRRAMKNGKAGRHWEGMVGYTVTDLKLHLEKQFEPNMSWKNYGEWHIDHCRPISWFSNDEKGVLRAWKISNLQPMWAHENLVKGNRWESPIKVKAII